MGTGLVRIDWIQSAVFVDSYQIKGVAKLAARRVRRMVRVCEFVIVENQSGCAGALGVGVSVLAVRWRINLRQELVYCFLDCVSPAESADQTFLFQRVLLLCLEAFAQFLFPGGNRPFFHVLPVVVLCEDFVRIQQLSVLDFELILAVLAAAGPVHQLGDPEGRIIEPFHFDVLCDLAGYCLVLIRRNIPAEWDDQSQPWMFRRMAVR